MSELKIIQIMSVEPGWYAKYHDFQNQEDTEILFKRVVALALVERINGNTTVESLVSFEHCPILQLAGQGAHYFGTEFRPNNRQSSFEEHYENSSRWASFDWAKMFDGSKEETA